MSQLTSKNEMIAGLKNNGSWFCSDYTIDMDPENYIKKAGEEKKREITSSDSAKRAGATGRWMPLLSINTPSLGSYGSFSFVFN